MSHGAMPYSGLNTSYPLANILTECEKLNEQLKEHKSILLGYPSITPTIISSPGLNNGIPQNNVMPGESEMILDIRLTPEINLGYILDRFDSIIENAKLKYDSTKFMYEILESRPPVKVDTNSKIVKALSDSYKFVTGNPPVIAGVPGATDGTIISKEKNIPVVVCGPGSVTAPHQIDEYIDISEIKVSKRHYRQDKKACLANLTWRNHADFSNLTKRGVRIVIGERWLNGWPEYRKFIPILY